jgi:nitrite reductase/ring-hydroxylating ferredoxin subunit
VVAIDPWAVLAVLLALGAKPMIVLNTAQGMKAFSAVCTHLG